MKTKPKAIPFDEIKVEWLKDLEVRRAYNALETEFQIADQMIGARIKQKISQQDLAKRVGTGQAVISRLESMNAHPSISLLSRIARALDTKFTITVQ